VPAAARISAAEAVIESSSTEADLRQRRSRPWADPGEDCFRVTSSATHRHV